MDNTKIGITELARRTLLSVGIGLAVGLLILLISCAAALSAEDPSKLITPLSMLALALSSLACGVASARLNRDELLPGAIAGLISGAVLVFMLFIMSSLPVEGIGSLSDGIRILYYLAVIALSGIGAFVGKKRGKYKPSHGKIPKNARKKRRRR